MRTLPVLFLVGSLLVLPASNGFAQTSYSFTTSCVERVTFSDDAGTGISAQKTYTHALDFGSSLSNPSINGVAFTSTSSASGALENGCGWSNFPPDAASGNTWAIASDSTSGIYQLLSDCNWNLGSGDMLLTGLTPGGYYDVRLYFRAWNLASERSNTLTFDPNGGSGRTIAVTINPDGVTENTDFYLSYRYRADETGSLTIRLALANWSEWGVNTLHIYGLSNEELPVPVVEHAGVATYGADTADLQAQVLWLGAESASLKLYWGLEDAGTNALAWAASSDALQISGTGTATRTATGLAAGQSYVARFCAETGFGSVWSDAFTFSQPEEAAILSDAVRGDVSETAFSLSCPVLYAGGADGSKAVCLWGVTDSAVTNEIALGTVTEPGTLTATVEGLESFREYWACFRVGSTQSACVYAIPAPAVAQRDILLTDLADGGSGTEFVGTARGLAVNLPDATWKNAGGWGSDVPLYSGEGWINLWHQNEIAALALTPNELFRMPRRMTLSVDFSLSDASQNGFGAGFWPETLPTSSQAQGNFTGLWLIRDNTRNTCTLTLWRSGFPVRSVELDALAEAFSGTARGTLSFQADLTAGILFDAELNGVPVGGFGTPAALPFADDAAHVGVITYSNANVYSLHLTGNAPYPCTIVVLR